MRPGARAAIVASVWLTACTGGPATSATTTATASTTRDASTGSTTNHTDGITSTSAGTSSATASTTSSSTGTTGDPESSSGCSFLCGDYPGSSECDPFVQDCDPGYKCNPWANDGGGAWNATKCVPVDPDPDVIGEPCTVVDSAVSGIDSCEKGAMCFYVDPVTDLGVCVGLCTGTVELCTDDAESCCPPGYSCSISAGAALVLCIQHDCDPILQDCDSPALSCKLDYGGFDRFACRPDGSGDGGAIGDPCGGRFECDPGTTCVTWSSFPGCGNNDPGCCAPYCNLDDPQCPPETECLPFYDPKDPPPAFVGLGVCIVPS